MTQFRPGRWMRTAMVSAAIGLTISACTAGPMRAYDENNNNLATDDYKAAVADFVAAVHAADADKLAELNDSDGTAAGVRELLARYAGATLTVSSYEFDHPGDAGAVIDVLCTDGGRASFDQGFLGVDGQWRPYIIGAELIPADTAPPLPGEAQSAPALSVSEPASQSVAATFFDGYPPCSKKPVATATS